MKSGAQNKKSEGVAADDKTVIKSMDEGDETTPSKPQYKPPYVVVVDGPRAGARFPLGEGSNIIGRSSGNAIRFEDQSVSRQHAEISKGSSGWIVKDLGSKNGTLVNGKQIAEAVVVGHKDIIKTGIYQLRLITQPIRLEEEMTLPPDLAMSDRTVFVASPPDSLTAELRKLEKEAEEVSSSKGEGEEKDLLEEISDLPPKKSKKNTTRQIVMFALLGIVVVSAVAYFANRILFKPGKIMKKQPPVVLEGPAPEAGTEQPGQVTGLPPAGQNLPPPAAEEPPPAQTLPPAQVVPVFLDFASSPMPVKVFFQEKEIGQTPIRVNIELEAGKTYQAEGLFEMPELKQQYRQKVDFTVEKDKSVVPILFRGPIGTLKVNNLPRDVQFYLEGKFSYDKFQDQNAKLQEIVLQKPIYIPFGNYVLELRRAKQLGQTSSTYIPDIIFHREFNIAEDSPSYTIEVNEEDLKIFPAKIRSDPPNADVFVDGKMVGKTPYEGTFPLGEHKLVLRKEGYFEYSEDLKMDINAPFAAEVKMKTSVAGAHINNARLAMNRAMYQDAVNELAEALNTNPAPGEVALANYLLGTCYLKTGDTGRAISYFDQAKNDETQRYPAMLGLANANAMLQRLDLALPLLVEVLLKAEDGTTKREAHDLFQKISPFRSVVYIYTDPPGAKVIVNDRPIEQLSPVILHELSLGNYRVRIEKTGYLPTDLNLTLSVNEFNPVVVKLKPIPQ